MVAQHELGGILDPWAEIDAAAPAVIESGGEAISYGALVDLADRVAQGLKAMGVRSGDRVAVCLPKSIDAIAVVFGVLRMGAAYVPIDPSAPPERALRILEDCQVACVFATASWIRRFTEQSGSPDRGMVFVRLDSVGGGHGLSEALESSVRRQAPGSAVPLSQGLAYILYTSGSTGMPKGVMHSQANAMAFLGWCQSAFDPKPGDRFSSHAPLHFDLSILDIFLPLSRGASVVLFDESTGRNPKRLAEEIEETGVTSWYSTPSVLTMMVQFGRLDRCDLSALRRVLFAGEVFPVKHLRLLREAIPHAEFFNLYGPTETNVCTWYRIPDQIPEDRTDPFPIGSACAPFETRILAPEGDDGGLRGRGELCIAGAGVMVGYWDRPNESSESFLVDDDGTRWYRTGDIVRVDVDENLVFLGRKDRMVKRRGYRVELGEVEAGLYRHPVVREVAALEVSDGDEGVRIAAVIGVGECDPPSILEMKEFSAQVLPAYMVPDAFVFFPALPKTSTDKIDLKGIRELV